MKNNQIQKFFAAAALVLGFAACAEDVDTNKNNENDGTQANITVSIRQGWDDDDATRAARAAQSSFAGETQVITAEGTIGGQPVYLWCREMDGIQTSNKTTAADEAEATRGVLMTNNNGFDANKDKQDFHNSFLIFGDGVESGTQASNPNPTKNVWSLSKSITWPDTDKTFYGLAPADGAYGTPSAAGFTYTTPTKATDQPDVMVGTATGSKATKTLHFQFRHVMSAIKFKIGSKGFTGGYKITNIELRGIYKKNTYTYTFNSTGGTWGTPTENGGAGVSETFDFKTADQFNQEITNPTNGKTFIVLPQTLPNDAKAIVTIKDTITNAETKIMAVIGGKTWQAGYTYTYVISSDNYPSDYEFETPGNPTFAYDGTAATGNTNTFKVISYKNEGNTKKIIGWDVVGYKVPNADGTTWPGEWSDQSDTIAMLNRLSQTSGTGSTTGESVTVTVNKQRGKEWRRQTILRAAGRGTRGTKNAPYDLSTHTVANPESETVPRTTANCYIVRYGGWYKIPLVIGNTIKNGNVNTPDLSALGIPDTDSKDITVSGTTRTYYYGKGTFVDYNGSSVTNGNYKIEGATSAAIVWHDFFDVDYKEELDVVDSLSLTTSPDADGLRYLTFYVDKNKIQQGNAVIAVKNGETIMWSWHIYVTDRDWTTDKVELTNRQNLKYTITNENLGCVEKVNGVVTYDGRKMKVLLRQRESNFEDSVTIVQNPYNAASDKKFWDAKFQWGRKDAIPGTGHTNETDPAGYFFPSNVYSTIREAATYRVAIQHPKFRYSGNSGYWCTQLYVNAWSAKNTTVYTSAPADNSVVLKTIYDPCPPGFCVPPSGAFTGFTTTGSNAAISSGSCNVSGSFSFGWNFFTNGAGSTTVYFPATSRVADAGLANGYGEQNWVWATTPGIPSGTNGNATLVCGYHLSFNSSNINVVIANQQKMAQSVRPMVEPTPAANIGNGVTVEPYGNGGTGNLDLQ